MSVDVRSLFDWLVDGVPGADTPMAVVERMSKDLIAAGEVAYGNIGGSSRLDFTAIGVAVNLAARLEGLTAKLGRSVVLSDELARHVVRPLDDLGVFELKGVPKPQRVFAPTS